MQDVAEATATRGVGQSGGITKPILQGLAGAIGFSMPGGILERGKTAAFGYIMITAMTKVTRSPLWRTATAIEKNKIADALATGNLPVFFTVAAKFVPQIKNLMDASQTTQ